MKIPCCDDCIVDPMCAAGCDELWNCHSKLKKDLTKYKRINGVVVNVMIAVTLFWGIGLLTGYVSIDQSTTMATVKYLEVTFWYWWFLIGHFVLVFISASSASLTKRTRKMINIVEDGERGSFIWNKRMEEEGKY